MIVAGIGSRKGVSGADVVAAIDAGLVAHGLARKALATLATTDFKRDEAGIFAAAKMLGLEVVVVSTSAHPASASLGHPLPVGERRSASASATSNGGQEQRLTGSSPRRGEGGRAKWVRQHGEGEDSGGLATLTHSALSLAVAGTPSVSETAALSAAGPGARLLGPRVATGRVTCALAESETPA